MADVSVRLGWASNLTRAARAALTELADVDRARVSGAPNGKGDDGVLNIHTATAQAWVDWGYAERVDDGIVITRDGLIKIGRVTISRAERQQRAAAESLAAQANGDWKPAPAGESAAASKRD
jgi:hypothetical protein